MEEKRWKGSKLVVLRELRGRRPRLGMCAKLKSEPGNLMGGGGEW